MRGFFITGTDTGVGKTLISAMIAVMLKEKGHNVVVRKPIETGCPVIENSVTSIDGLFLKTITGTSDDIDVISPVRLIHPLAPLVAAELEGVTIDVDRLLKSLTGIDGTSLAIVEGAGGLLVPITATFFVSDLIKALGLPAILVSSNRLGTINHTLLSLEHMKYKGIATAGVIFNDHRPDPDDMSVTSNIEQIRRLSDVAVLAAVPFLRAINYNTLADASKCVDYGIIQSFL